MVADGGGGGLFPQDLVAGEYYIAEGFDSRGVLMRANTPNGNGGEDAAKEREFPGAHFGIEEACGVGIGDQGDEGLLRRQPFKKWRGRLGSSLAENKNCSQGHGFLLEAQAVFGERKHALIPIGRKARELLLRAVQHGDRISPERKIPVGGQHVKGALALDKRDDIIGKDGMAAARECGSRGRFSRAGVADERYRAAVKHDGAGMKARDAAQPEQKSENGAQEKGSGVLERRGLRPLGPDGRALRVEPKLHSVPVGNIKIGAACNFPNAHGRLPVLIPFRARKGEHSGRIRNFRFGER